MSELFDGHALYVLGLRRLELEKMLRSIDNTIDEQQLARVEKAAKLESINKAIVKLS